VRIPRNAARRIFFCKKTFDDFREASTEARNGNFSFRKIAPRRKHHTHRAVAPTSRFALANTARRRSAWRRSQPAPPPPMLRNGGSGAVCSLRSPQSDARPLTRAQPRRTRTSARPPQSPSPPLLRNGGSGDLRLAPRQLNQPTASRNSIRLVQPNRLWPSNALPLRAVEHALPIRTSAEQPARQAPLHPQPVTLAASARCTSNAPPLRDHERPPRNQRQQNHARHRTASFGRVYDAVVAPASP
jgi:hypothetical protein